MNGAGIIPPGCATVLDSGRVIFNAPAMPVAVGLSGRFHAEPLGDGRAILRDERGQSWGIFANAAMCESTAERLSR